MKDDMTSEDFIKQFDHFRRDPTTGNVIIRPGLPYNHIELTGEFVESLKNDLSKKIMMAHTGMDRLSPTEKFAIMILEDAF